MVIVVAALHRGRGRSRRMQGPIASRRRRARAVYRPLWIQQVKAWRWSLDVTLRSRETFKRTDVAPVRGLLMRLNTRHVVRGEVVCVHAPSSRQPGQNIPAKIESAGALRAVQQTDQDVGIENVIPQGSVRA